MRVPSEFEELKWDFNTISLTTGRHPLALRRPELERLGAASVREAFAMKPNSTVRLAGAVISRQRPPTAKGFTFMILEDETEYIPTALQPSLYDRFAAVLREGTLLVEGRLESAPEEITNKTRIYRSIFIEQIGSLDAVTGRGQAWGIRLSKRNAALRNQAAGGDGLTFLDWHQKPQGGEGMATPGVGASSSNLEIRKIM